jgi:hypothetical protein
VGSQLSTDDEASYDKVVDLAGKLVLPGLQDSHLHILMLGEMLENVNLSGTTTVAAILTLVEARAASAAPDTWLVGIHWDHEKIAEGRPPTRQELDAICPNAYVLLYRSCYHVAVVNTKTLLLLGIPLDEDPSVLQALNVAASTVEYHDGSASGLLKEEATYLARAAQSKQITVADRERCIKRGLQEALCCGLTAVQPNDEQAWGVYKGLHARNELPIRVHLTQPYVELQDWDADKPVEPPFKACSTADDMLRCERIKVGAQRARATPGVIYIVVSVCSCLQTAALEPALRRYAYPIGVGHMAMASSTTARRPLTRWCNALTQQAFSLRCV